MAVKKYFILEEPYMRINAGVVRLLSGWNTANNTAEKRFNLYN
jgi:hypothetical protein